MHNALYIIHFFIPLHIIIKKTKINMKSIINSKNALSALFLIPLLTSAISFTMTNDVNYAVPTSIYMVCYFTLGLAYFYLATTENEYIINKKQKVSMYILFTYYLVWDALICRLLNLINKDWKVIKVVTDLCGDEKIGSIAGLFIYAIFGFIHIVAFLMFIWGIPTKKSYKWGLTLAFFIPMIESSILPFTQNIAENIIVYSNMIYNIAQIISNGLMLFLITKAYKPENRIK